MMTSRIISNVVSSWIQFWFKTILFPFQTYNNICHIDTPFLINMKLQKVTRVLESEITAKQIKA